MELDATLSAKARDLIDSFKKAEEKWSKTLNEKDEFIRRRDHTITSQMETIDAVSKEVHNLTEKNKRLQQEQINLEKKFIAEKEERQKANVDKISAMEKYIEARKDVKCWKTKYNKLKSHLKEEFKRRQDVLSDDEDSSQIPKKMIRSGLD